MMEDERWTLVDKFEQFRGVTNLYNSKAENARRKKSVLRKKQNKEMKNLATQNKKYHNQYEEILHGEKKSLLPLLNTHPTMQLAMKNLNVQQIQEELKQTIFCKNKELDRLRYKRKNLETELLDKKLELSKIQNKTEELTENYVWEQELTNQLQSVSVKVNTAIANRDVYEKTLDILQKDAIRFDEVIEELKKDLVRQSETIVRAEEMNLSVKEELAKLQREYRATERAVRANMKKRNKTLRSLRADIDEIRLHNQVSQVESPQVPSISENDITEDMKALIESNNKNEISSVSDMLCQIKEATMVRRVQDICPRLEHQKKQKAWLEHQIDQTEDELDRMLELNNQLDVMLEVTMYHTLTDEAKQLRAKRVQLCKEVNEEKQNWQDTEAEVNKIGDNIVSVRVALMTFSLMIDSVMPENDGSETDFGFSFVSETGNQSSTTEDLLQLKPDALTLMKQVSNKIKLLLDKVDAVAEEPKPLPVIDVESSLQFDFEDETDNIVSNMLNELEEMEDPTVPTRKDIKASSKKLVDAKEDPRASFQTDSGPKFRKHKCF